MSCCFEADNCQQIESQAPVIGDLESHLLVVAIVTVTVVAAEKRLIESTAREIEAWKAASIT